MKSVHDAIICPFDYFFTSGIQALQHWWKNDVDRKWDYVEKNPEKAHSKNES